MAPSLEAGAPPSYAGWGGVLKSTKAERAVPF